MSIVKWYIKSLGNNGDVIIRNITELMNDDRFRRFRIIGGSARKDSFDTLYVKDVIEVLQEKNTFCGKSDTMFHMERENALSTARSRRMTTAYFRAYH